MPAPQPHATPAAWRVVFHKGADRGRGGPDDAPARQASRTADPRRRSTRPRTERTHIPTIAMPAERARQAAPHTWPHQATEGASSSSAAPLPASPAGPLPVGQKTADARQGGPQQTTNPDRGWGDEPLKAPPRPSGVTAPAPDTGMATRPTGPMRHGAPHPGSDAAKPTGQGGCSTTAGAQRRRRGSGGRNDRGLRPSGVG